MAKFLDTYNLPNLNCEYIENLKMPIMSDEFESDFTKVSQERKVQVQVSLLNFTTLLKNQHGLISDYFKKLKGEIIKITSKLQNQNYTENKTTTQQEKKTIEQYPC